MIFSCKKVTLKTIYKIDMDLENDIAGEMVDKQGAVRFTISNLHMIHSYDR